MLKKLIVGFTPSEPVICMPFFCLFFVAQLSFSDWKVMSGIPYVIFTFSSSEPMHAQPIGGVNRSTRQTLSQMLYRVHLVWAGFESTTLVVIDTDCTSSYKSNYHTATIMVPVISICVVRFSWMKSVHVFFIVCFYL